MSDGTIILKGVIRSELNEEKFRLFGFKITFIKDALFSSCIQSITSGFIPSLDSNCIPISFCSPGLNYCVRNS
jgi:hypothetical protein